MPAVCGSICLEGPGSAEGDVFWEPYQYSPERTTVICSGGDKCHRPPNRAGSAEVLSAAMCGGHWLPGSSKSPRRLPPREELTQKSRTPEVGSRFLESRLYH